MWVGSAVAAFAVLFSDATAIADTPAKAGPLFGGFPEQLSEPTVSLDPSLPTGEALEVGTRPTATTARLCSWRYPLCVHGDPKHDPAQLSKALSAFEVSYQMLIGALRLPPPLSDLGAGGSGGLDAYLVATDRSLRVLPDFPSIESDQSSAFCLVPTNEQELRGSMLRCLAEAISFRLDAAETPASRAAYAAHLAWITGQAGNADLAAIDDAQATPELAPVTRERSERSAAGALLFEMLESEWGEPTPGAIATVLYDLSRSDAPSSGLQWNNEPDLLDVIRHTLGKKPSDSADWLGNFMLTRALFGIDARRTPLAALAATGDFGKIRYDWRIKFSSLPRRVAATRPLEPLGATYLWLDLDEVPLGARLGFRAEWESPVTFKWLLVALDKQGREVARLDVPYLEHATSVERTWVNFEAASAIVITGMSLGDVDLGHPFDPDYEPWEPHGCTVYLAKL